MTTAAPGFAWRARVHVDVAEPIEYGPDVGGMRRVVPIVGGEVAGEWVGQILAGGADWQTVLDDGSVLISARYPVRLIGVGDVVFDVRGARSAIGTTSDFCTTLIIDGPADSNLAKSVYATVGRKSDAGVDYDLFEVT